MDNNVPVDSVCKLCISSMILRYNFILSFLTQTGKICVVFYLL